MSTCRACAVVRTYNEPYTRLFCTIRSLAIDTLSDRTSYCQWFYGLTLGPKSDSVGVDRPKRLASSIECSLPPASPADATGESRTHTVLHGMISSLKLIQQIVVLAPVPGFPNLVGVVLNISEVVNVSFGATYILHVKY